MSKSTEASGDAARKVRANVSVLIVAGPSGSGKTTLGRLLAQRLGWDFEDADEYHTPEAVAKMASGEGLTDEDRQPWLDRLAATIQARASGDRPMVLACSALTRGIRRRLMTETVVLVWMDVPREVLRQRLESREAHFAGASLLPSQLATSQAPTPEEGGISVDGGKPLAEVLQNALKGLARLSPYLGVNR